ncbi:MAG: class I SAM-dependent methyltransferase [Patescibacteria group bacterium]
MTDIFGKFLNDYSKNKKVVYFIRRDDGFFNKAQDVKIYFSKYREWKKSEKEILKYVRGKVLDIGAGAGRHSLYLQNKGFKVWALDISPGAVKLMQKRGIKNVVLMDLRKLNFPKNYFDTTLLMFNNFGLAGSVRQTRKFLKNLYKITTPRGRIIATIRNPYKTKNPKHLAYHQKNIKAGKPAGLIKIRIEYKKEKGNWFLILMVSPSELEKLLLGTGWKILKIIEERDGTYGVVLKKFSTRPGRPFFWNYSKVAAR